MSADGSHEASDPTAMEPDPAPAHWPVPPDSIGWSNKRFTRHVEWLMMAVVLMLIGGLGAYARYVERQDVEATESARLRGQAKTVTDNLQQQLQAVSIALLSVRSEFPQPDNVPSETASRRLKLLSDMMPGVRSLAILDAQGTVRASNRDGFVGRNFADRDYFKVPRAQADEATLYISRPFTTALGVYAISVARVVPARDGEFAGLVTAILDPEYFHVVARSVLYASDMSTSIVHGDGFVILNEPYIENGAPPTSLRQPGFFFSRHMDSGQISTVFSGTVRSTGAQRMMAQHTLQPSDLHMDKPLVIAMARDLSGIYQPWLRQTQLYALLFVICVIAAGAALHANQRHRIRRAALAAEQEHERRRRELQRTAQLSDRLLLTEAGLHETEQRLSLAADAARLGIWSQDLAHDEVWASEQWRSLFGFEASQPLDAKLVHSRVHPDDREAVGQMLARSMHDPGGYEVEFRIELPDGRLRWIASRGRADFNDVGQPILMRGVSVEITARKQAEFDAHQQRAEVTRLSRVTMLGELSGALAHELNQPLTAILSNAQAAQRFLAQEAVDVNELRDILQDIVDEDKRAGEVIRRLRLLLSTGQTQRQSVDLNELVAEMFKLLRSDLVNQRVTMRAELAKSLPEVHADRVQLQQIVINLVMNACDAMKSLPAAERQLVVRTELAAGEGVRVSVIDQGCGIPVADVEKVFDSFFTTKATGMGLGLSVCRTIVTAHGGRIWAENNPDRGASLHFSLPLLLAGAA